MMILEWKGIVLLFAVGIDLLFGEPPNRLHPVAWMGTAIDWLKRRCPSENWFICLTWGFGITLIGTVLLTIMGIVIEYLTSRSISQNMGSFVISLYLLLNAYVLKMCLGIRSLWKASDSVDDALQSKDLQEARRSLAYHLVSRDVRNLDESEISAATIESVAENTSDSVIAPVFFYLLAGLPGALVYRYINTCDAMLGYRTASLQWLGKVPARTDDLLNLIPARITAGLMMLSSLRTHDRYYDAFHIWWSNSGKTESPNAGHPMSAAAGLIGVRLEKTGHYVLGDHLRVPTREDIATMNSLFLRTVFIAIALSSISCFALRGLSQ